MRISNQIVLASSNRGKLDEFRSLFQAHPGLELLPAKARIRNAEKLSIVETFDTYAENAVAKARTGNQACHYPCLADDTGLEVMALEGRPGVRSHRYAIPKAGQGQDEANVEKLLTELKGVSPEQRKARFVAVLALVLEGVLIHEEGVLEGSIIEAPRGDGGFGYDSVFVPEGSEKTLAEMSRDEKNTISHRAVAFQKLMEEIQAKGIAFAKP